MKRFYFVVAITLLLICSCSKHHRHNKSKRAVRSEYVEVVPDSDNDLDVSDGVAAVDQEQIISDAITLDLEIPVSTTSRPEQIIHRATYTTSYNSETQHPNWSAWVLTGDHEDGPYKRKDLDIRSSYLEDEESLKGRQFLSDWKDTPGYDHGHMCPSGDNKWDLNAMYETFYLSNMCAQRSDLNQGPWEHLESKCRSWAKKYGEIYIVCGPIFLKKPYKKIGRNGKLCVPDAFFKVVLCTNGEPKSLGFIYENKDYGKGDKMEYHVTTVDQVEEITGFDFFSDLPDEVENVIEAHADIKNWSKR